MRVYLDNCCFNRPYDDQTHVSISIETQAKLYIQQLIHIGEIELVNSYMLEYENNVNPFHIRRDTIRQFLNANETIYVSGCCKPKVDQKAQHIQQTGVKYKDACHIACAILANCDALITTDKRMLKYQTDEIQILDPVTFLKEIEGD